MVAIEKDLKEEELLNWIASMIGNSKSGTAVNVFKNTSDILEYAFILNTIYEDITADEIKNSYRFLEIRYRENQYMMSKFKKESKEEEKRGYFKFRDILKNNDREKVIDSQLNRLSEEDINIKYRIPIEAERG